MGFISTLFGIGESDPVAGLLTSLRDKDEGTRLQAIAELGRIGPPKALGPLLYALKDDNQEIRSTALACLVAAGVEEASAKRLSIVYDEKTPWRKGLIDLSNRIKLASTIMENAANIAGLSSRSLYGGLNTGIVGFLFNDEHKALEAALNTNLSATVFIWRKRSMSKYEFGPRSNEEAFKVATMMHDKGATAFIAANSDTSLEKGLVAIFKTEAQLRW